MAGVSVKIPGTAGIVEAKAALMMQAVQHQWNIVTAPVQTMPPRRPSAGDAGKRLHREAGLMKCRPTTTS